jgi:hypothetical protein
MLKENVSAELTGLQKFSVAQKAWRQEKDVRSMIA